MTMALKPETHTHKLKTIAHMLLYDRHLKAPILMKSALRTLKTGRKHGSGDLI